MNLKIIFMALLGVLVLYLGGTILAKPLHWLGRTVLSLALGGALLLLVNLTCAGIGLHVAVNPFTLLTAGVLQVPGVILLVVLSDIA